MPCRFLRGRTLLLKWAGLPSAGSHQLSPGIGAFWRVAASDALDTPVCSGILRRLFRHDGSHLRRQRDLCRLSPGGSGPMALIAAQAGHAARRRQNGAGRFLRCELRSSAFADGDNRGPDQFSLSVRPTRPWAHCSPSASHDEDNAPGSRHGRLDEGHARLRRRSTDPPSR